VKFTEPVLPSSVNGSTFMVADGALSIFGSVQVSGDTATFTPAADLPADGSIVTTLVGGAGAITDLAGNPLAQNHAYAFFTSRRVRSLVAGASHTCVGRHNRKLFCWGSNASGQLGAGAGDSASPLEVAGEWDSVSGGYEHTCAIKTGGSLWCWGGNGGGQLGDGSQIDRAAPTPIDAGPWKAVAAGQVHTCGLKVDGQVLCWGDDSYQALGDGAVTTGRLTPFAIAAPAAMAITAGATQSCAVTTTGELWCWGDNSSGELGLAGPVASLPTRVGTDADWSEVKAGTYFTCGLKAAGGLFCWGWNGSGQLGDGTTTSRAALGTSVGGAGSWAGVAAGDSHACGRLDTGELFCWGDSYDGQIGNGTLTRRLSPAPLGAAWDRVAAGISHTCAVATSGLLQCWGNNRQGALGYGIHGGAQNAPAQVGFETDWFEVAAGNSHSCGIRGAGDLYCWGGNGFGILADGTTVKRAAPALAGYNGAGFFNGWVAVAAGGNASHACGIRDTAGARSLWCWGNNSSRQLARATPASSLVALEVTGQGTSWASVSTGGTHTCARKTTGEFLCWGGNSSGQLGNGTTTTTEVPVVRAAPWLSVAASNASACGVNGAFQVMCAGANFYGELGRGTSTISETSLGQAGATSDYAEIYPGWINSCARKNDGSLWCWGANSGLLGTGTTANQLSPARVGADNDWTAASGGGSFWCGLRGPTLVCWGGNGSGQVGDGTNTNRAAPAVVGTGWSRVSSGSAHACGVKSDGTLWCWGQNQSGQLGNDAAWKTTPQIVPFPDDQT
jgi:alpha-tubulin suppressor-like RCC1 family protein